jgi:hypothetical protein
MNHLLILVLVSWFQAIVKLMSASYLVLVKTIKPLTIEIS